MVTLYGFFSFTYRIEIANSTLVEFNTPLSPCGRVFVIFIPIIVSS